MINRIYPIGIGLLACALTAAAGTICPAGNGANPFPHSPNNAATGCNVVITISGTSTLTATTVLKDATPYDNVEDFLVGVVNNSTTPITSLGLSGSGIFGFDGDGMCTFTFVGDGYCSASQRAGTNPQDYQGPTSTFTITNFNNGVVNFSSAITNGSTFFSLEGSPSAALQGTPNAGTPEPASMALVGLGLTGLAMVLRRRRN